MLVPKMINIPSFIRYNEVVFVISQDILKYPKIPYDNFIHPAQGFKNVEIMLASFFFDMSTFARQSNACAVADFTCVCQKLCDRVLGKPFYFYARLLGSEGPGNRHIAPCMAQADR